MRVLSIIFGILMTIFGIVFMFTPLVTVLGLNIYIIILIAVYGVFGIITSISNKSFGVGFVFSILSVLFAVLIFFFPYLIAITDTLIIYFAAGWMLVQGIVSIIVAIQSKGDSTSKMWIFELIIGILGVLVGIYSFFHPILFGITLAWLIGILIGVFFIQSGISMIFYNPKSK